MKSYVKKDFPVSDIRRFLEPGPIVLVSSAYRGATNLMTMGWHTVMEFTPSLVGCVIASSNHSFELIRKSRECVINVPTDDLAPKVVGIGNCSGRDVDKFAAFGLTAVPGAQVKAPLVAECYASLECKLVDARLVRDYNFFIFECVQAHAATSPRYPRTIHYRGDGVFMLSGPTVTKYRKLFRPEML
ncbi:MAG TPA: flavin reductase family protein [Myxococcales bacterium]|jgi:flavin reductase (DIM6/NTAB) family NADH-FMN oxidoreductase RutF